MQIAQRAEQILGEKGFADKFYDYMSKGWYSLASPVWSNYGKTRGLSASCFGSTTNDSVPGILKAATEIGAMSKLGGGTAIYLGNLRPRGSAITDNGESTGPVHFLELFQSITDVISQGSQRRGRTAAYMPITHPDFEEFLTVGTEGSPLQTILTAATIPENWMQEMIDGDSSKRKLWAALLKRRSETGYPYIFFGDNVAKGRPDVYKDKPNSRLIPCLPLINLVLLKPTISVIPVFIMPL
jgi:ribonucleoside-diphosphate reductase alpha chain